MLRNNLTFITNACFWSRALIIIVICCLVSSLQAVALPQQKTYCQRGDPCWPNANDVEALIKVLDPEKRRILVWSLLPNPRICAIPIFSPDDQPLYGWGKDNLLALHDDPYFDPRLPCFIIPGDNRSLCMSSQRNNPKEGWSPGFVVWALDETHVQAAVRFAVKHNLCIMVAGTGHDFMNRHSCSDGIMIRTTLLKNIEWDLEDKKGFGNVGGNVRLGTGIVFHEAHKSASDNDRFISSGWAITVGITGWSIGGGHGPLASSLGLGVDNILEADIVLANGNMVTVNSKTNTDLYWAIRGGGGSTWGVITALTLKAHKIPDGGFSVVTTTWSAGMCENGRKILHQFIDTHEKWSQTLDEKWSGITFIAPEPAGPIFCGATWVIWVRYVYQGPADDPEAEKKYLELMNGIPLEPSSHSGIGFANYWGFAFNYPIEPITVIPMENFDIGSVLVGRDTVSSGALSKQLKDRIDDCATIGNCVRMELYQAITGNINSPQDPTVSIPSGFRTAVFHFVFGSNWTEPVMDSLYALGENSYFSESSYTMKADSWKQRYWGDNYQQLLEVKRKWDPENAFWCRRCVGSDL